jgi:DNA-binding NtrC family response regulator
MLQAKVLRAVEQGEVLPLGSNKAPQHVDVRLICATNRDIAGMAREGKFRDDLYYRLGVMTMELPPLRSYKEGALEVMAHVFLQQAAERHHKMPPPRIGARAMSTLMAYDYPGNVRELKNAIEHAVIMCDTDEIEPEDLPRSFHDEPERDDDTPRARGTLRELREAWLAPRETKYLRELLDECRGNVREAAARAGVNPVTMYRLLRKRGLMISREVRRAED